MAKEEKKIQPVVKLGDCTKLYVEPIAGLPLGRIKVEVHKGDKVYRLPKTTFTAEHRVTSTGGVTPCYPKYENWLQDNVKYRPTDVVITTYPKCGTTLMEQIVLLLQNNGNADMLDPSTQNALQDSPTGVGKLWPDSCVVPNDFAAWAHKPDLPKFREFTQITLDQFNAYPNTRILKSHANDRTLLSKDANGIPAPAKYIVSTRNMFDACVSSYYHDWNPGENGWPFDAWALIWMTTGWSTYGHYFEWHKGIYQLCQRFPPKNGGTPTQDPEFFWIHYEDILSKPQDSVAKVAAFLGINASPELIDSVVDGASFDKMKEKALEKGRSSHLRSGKVGGWRDYFTPELANCFRNKYEEFLHPLGLKYRIGNGEILE